VIREVVVHGATRPVHAGDPLAIEEDVFLINCTGGIGFG
jgi:hypothetical protein